MASILDKYKKDSSQTLLNKYKESAQKPSVLKDKERVSLNANPVLNNTTVINENILPDLTDKEGKVMSEDADFFTKLFKTGASVVADVLHGIGKSYEDFVDYIASLGYAFDSSGKLQQFVERDIVDEKLGDFRQKAHENSFYDEDSKLSELVSSFAGTPVKITTGQGLFGGTTKAIESDLRYGIYKGIEGVVDAGATIASQFDDSGKIAEFVKQDYADKLLGGNQEVSHKNAIYKEDSLPSEIFQAVGQMLPSIAIGGGAGTAFFGVSAGGSSAEQAFLEGATEEEALAYGTISGLVETGIELLSGGIGGVGKGVLQKVAPNVTTSIAKNATTKVLINMAGEGLEEMASEVLNPLMKSIYDNQALEEYQDEEFVSNVLKAGALGTLTSAVLIGGNVALTTKQQRIGNDIVDMQNELLDQVAEGNVEQVNKLTKAIESKYKQFEESIKDFEKSEQYKEINRLKDTATALELERQRKAYSNLLNDKTKQKQKEKFESEVKNLEQYQSDKIKSMDAKARKKYLNKNSLNHIYDKNGNIRQEYSNLDTKTKARQNYVANAFKRINRIMSNQPLSLYFSNDDEINGKIVGNSIYLSNDILQKDNWKQFTIKTLGHEITHSQENKGVYDLAKSIFYTEKNQKDFVKRLSSKKQLYDTKANEGIEGLEDYRNMSEEQKLEYLEKEVVADYFGEALSSEEGLKRLVDDDRNFAQKVLDFFKSLKQKLTTTKAEKNEAKEMVKELNEIITTFETLLAVDKNVTVEKLKEKETKYSLKEDSEGNKLSEEQIEFFKDSKVVDEEGRLLPVYHGTRSEFYIFDKSLSGSSNKNAKVGFWFTPNEKGAINFANDIWYGKKPKTLKVYLNIINPKIYKSGLNEIENENLEKSKNKLKELNDEMKKLNDKYDSFYFEKYIEYSYYNNLKYSYNENHFKENKNILQKLLKESNTYDSETVNNIIKTAKRIWSLRKKIIPELQNQISELKYNDSYEKFRTDIYKTAGFTAEDANFGGIGKALMDENGKFLNDTNVINDFVSNLKKEGYDGIIIENTGYDSNTLGEGKENTQYVAFDSNQIKLTSNKTPTKTSNDIRYALKEDDDFDDIDLLELLNSDDELEIEEFSEEDKKFKEHYNTLSENQQLYLTNDLDSIKEARVKLLDELGYNFDEIIFKVTKDLEDKRKYKVLNNNLYANGADDVYSKVYNKIIDIYSEENFGYKISDLPATKLIELINDSNQAIRFASRQYFKENLGKIEKTLNNELTNGQKTYFKNSKVKDKNGNLILMFHGTPNADMEYFDSKRIGTTGTVRGSGFYLIDNFEEAFKYSTDDGKILTTFVNIEKPLNDRAKSMSKNELSKLIKVIDSTGEEFLSNYGDVYSEGYNEVLNKALNNLITYNSTDNDIIQDVYRFSGLEFEDFFDKLKNTLGYDGVVFDRNEGIITLAFNSNQVKEVNNLKPTTSKLFKYDIKAQEPEIKLDTIRKVEFLSKTAENLIFNRVNVKNKEFNSLIPQLEEYKGALQTEFRKILEGTNRGKKVRNSSLIKILSTKVDGNFTLYDIIRIAELGERTQQPLSLPDQQLLFEFLKYKNKVNEIFYYRNPIKLVDENFLPTYLKNVYEKSNAVGKPIHFVVDKDYDGGTSTGGWYNTLSKHTYTVVNTGWNVVKVVNHENFHGLLGKSPETFKIASKFMKDVEDLLIQNGDFEQAVESIAKSSKDYRKLIKSPFTKTNGFSFNNQQNSLLEELCCEIIAGDFESSIKELHKLREKFLKDNPEYFVEDAVEGNVDRTSLKPFDYDNFERVNFDVEQTIKKGKVKIEINEETIKDKLKHDSIAFKNAFTDSSSAYLEAMQFFGVKRQEAEQLMNLIRAFRNRTDYALQNGVRNLSGEKQLSKAFDDIFHNWINEKYDISTQRQEYEQLKKEFFDYLRHYHNIDRMNIIRQITKEDIIKSEILEDEEKEKILEYLEKLEKTSNQPIDFFEPKFVKHLIADGHYDLFEADFKENVSVFGRYTRLDAFSDADKAFLNKVAPDIYKKLKSNSNVSEAEIEEALKDFTPEIDITDFEIDDSGVLNSKQRYKIVERATGKVIAKYETREQALNEIEDKISNYYTRLIKRKLRVSLTQVSTQDSKKTIERYEKEHPEFKEHAEDVWELSRALMKLRLEGGLITKELHDELNKRYRHYVPTTREIESNLGRKSGSGSGTSVNSGIKTAKGSDIVFEPIDVIFSRQLNSVYNNIAINKMANALYDAKVNSQSKDISRVRLKEEVVIRKTIDEVTDENNNLVGEKGKIVTFIRDGKTISMEVNDQIGESFQAINAFTGYSSEKVLLSYVAKANKAFKGLVTEYNPFFLVRNFLRDIQDALLYSKNGTMQLLKNLPKAFFEIKNNGELFQKYCAMGGLYSSIFDYNSGTITAKPKNKFQRNKAVKIGREIKNFVGKANMVVEQSVRFAELLTSLDNGKTWEEAFYDAQEITVNFGKSGVVTKKLNSTLVPFLNAQVQGFCKITRTIFSKKSLNEWSSLLLRALLIGLTPSLLNYLLYYDDDEYQGLSDYYKDQNYLIKIGDKFFKIPKGRLVTVISTALINFVEMARGQEDAFSGYAETVKQAVSPVNDFRTIFSPISDVKTNTTWYGGQIESSKFSNIKPSDRYDKSTSIIAKGLGKVFNYSPKKIDYIIDQYSGVIGDVLIPATSSDSRTNALTFVTSNLTVDSVYKTRYYADFSSKLTKLQYLKTDGDAIATLQVKYMNKVKSKIAELYDEQRRIEEDKTLSAKEKKEQLKTIQLLINNMYNTAYQNVDALGSNLKNLPLTEDSINDDYYYGLYLTFGAEATLSLHSEKLYEKAKNLVENSTLTYDDFLLTYFDCKGMRKSEAIQYIQSLPMSKQNKQKLLESLF